MLKTKATAYLFFFLLIRKYQKICKLFVIEKIKNHIQGFNSDIEFAFDNLEIVQASILLLA